MPMVGLQVQLAMITAPDTYVLNKFAQYLRQSLHQWSKWIVDPIVQISFFLLERQFDVCHVIQRVIHLEMQTVQL